MVSISTDSETKVQQEKHRVYLASTKPVLAMEYVKYSRRSWLYKPKDGTDDNNLNIAIHEKENSQQNVYEELKFVRGKNISPTLITGK